MKDEQEERLEQNAVAQARERLSLATERLGQRITALREENERLTTQVSEQKNDEESAKWQNACHALEAQVVALKEENSQLEGELHQAREQISTLETSVREAAILLDTAIVQVEALLKE